MEDDVQMLSDSEASVDQKPKNTSNTDECEKSTNDPEENEKTQENSKLKKKTVDPDISDSESVKEVVDQDKDDDDASNQGSDNNDNKEEKNPLEQSFDLSSDDDDDDEDNANDDARAKENAEDLDEDAKYLDDLLNEKDKATEENNNENVEKNGLMNDKQSMSSDIDKTMPSTSNSQTALTKSEIKKKNQAIENSSKELARKRKLELMEEENKKMQVLMANFSEEQLNRYEIYRRSAFQKSSVKKIIQTVCGKNVSASVIIAMSGIAKVFVGEIVEKALDVKSKWSDTGPIQPKHLREAFRLTKNSNRLTTSVKAKKPQLLL